MRYFVDENGEVQEYTKEMAKDPFRESCTVYAKKADAELVAEIGEDAAAHARSQKKLGLTDEEYERYVRGG